ncbi:hypothetical protein A4G29_21780 [Mycobacterium kansasii]|nr:hypothetical protein A4G29_21780 [Mycobacterium kansasii]
MDYAALPPEVNSARMYTGPGCGPMLAAALAWDSLSSELSAAAQEYETVIAGMTSGPWRGPASSAMAAAVGPYIAWLATTASQALQASAQAKAAAAAYEAAFAMTVPPAVIAANRAQLASLVATNLFGQNTPAIAATEALYGQMWAQDAAAMYGYAASSVAATQLDPFADAPMTTSGDAGALVQAGSATSTPSQGALSQVMQQVPVALQGLASPAGASTTGADLFGLLGSGIQDWIGLSGADLSSPAGILAFLSGTDGSPLGVALSSVYFNALSSGFYTPGNFLGTLADAVGLHGAEAVAEAATGAAAGRVGGAVSAVVGNAATIGPLSVPPAWTATSSLGAAASALPSNAAATAPAITGATPSMLGGMPLSGLGARSFAEAPRYGFRPIVMVHPPAAG